MFKEFLNDPWFFFVASIVAGLVITLIAGLLAMVARVLCEAGHYISRRIRWWYEDHHALRRIRSHASILRCKRGSK